MSKPGRPVTRPIARELGRQVGALSTVHGESPARGFPGLGRSLEAFQSQGNALSTAAVPARHPSHSARDPHRVADRAGILPSK